MRRGDAALVSVVMAARNEEQFIAEALESVLAQAYEPLEVLVVDDGSTDATAAIAGRYGVEVLARKHGGPSAARNAGLRVARGEFWVAFDADDVMPVDRISTQVSYLEEHRGAGTVLGLTEAFVTPGQARPPYWNPAWSRGPFHGHPGTMMARREVLDVVGFYDESLRQSEDLDWQARAREAGVSSGRIEHLCLRYRVHSGNTSGDGVANRTGTFAMLRQGIQRRRAPGALEGA